VTPMETLALTRYVKACCPQQAIDEYTPDAWHELLKDLNAEECRVAVTAVAKRQPFVAPAEVRAEVRRIREARLARTPLPAPAAELTDSPGRYRDVLLAHVERIANGFGLLRAIGPGPIEGEPPRPWREVRKTLGKAIPRRETPRELARRQAAESQAAREAARNDDPPAGEAAL
jgi:hypothetical protein